MTRVPTLSPWCIRTGYNGQPHAPANPTLDTLVRQLATVPDVRCTHEADRYPIHQD